MQTIGPDRAKRGFTLLELMVVIAILAAMAGLVVPLVSETEQTSKEDVSIASLAGCRDALTGTGTLPGLYADVRYLPAFNVLSLRTVHLLEAGAEFNVYPYDPATRRGWRGPYVRGGNILNTIPNSGSIFPAANHIRFDGDKTFGARGFFPTPPADMPNGYGLAGEAAVGDAWGNPIILQIPDESDFAAFPANQRAAARWKFARIVSAGPNGELQTSLSSALAGRISSTSTAGRGDDLVLFLNRSDVYETVAP